MRRVGYAVFVGAYTAVCFFSVTVLVTAPIGMIVSGSFVGAAVGFFTAVAIAVVAALLAGYGAYRNDVEFQRRRTGCCPRCGYNLRESTGRCPECGRPFRRG